MKYIEAVKSDMMYELWGIIIHEHQHEIVSRYLKKLEEYTRDRCIEIAEKTVESAPKDKYEGRMIEPGTIKMAIIYDLTGSIL